MEAPFDFTRSHSDEVPRGRRFAPLQKSDTLESFAWILPVLVGVLCLLLLARKFLAVRREQELYRLQWHAVIHTCREHGLVPKRIRHFVEFLQRHPRISPQRAISSLHYFDDSVATPLRKNSGAVIMEDIRKHLFLRPVTDEYAETPPEKQADILHEALASTFEAPTPLKGTLLLVQGENVKLHIEGWPEMLHCAVAAVLEECFIVVLPPDMPGIQPRAGQAVEGFFNRQEMFYSFESTVESVSGSKINLCRIRHAAKLIETNRRQFTRVAVRQKLTLHLASHAALAGTEAKAPPTRTHEAFMTDISAGGCALELVADAAPQVGDILQFQLRLHPNRAPTDILGKILSVDRQKAEPVPGSHGRPILLHVEFIHLSQKTQDMIDEIIHRQKTHKGT